jgi:secreted PhoX family phosphatase
MMSFSRRKFLTLAGATAAGVTMVSPLEAFYARVAHGKHAAVDGYGPLRPRLPVNAEELTSTVLGDLSQEAFLALPRGFNYTVISVTGQQMSDGSLVPAGHDGMAAFPGPSGTTILVRNHELSTSLPPTYNYPVVGTNRYSPVALGGTTTLVVGRNRRLVKDFVSLAGTRTNCAGGDMYWGSWITCEETFSATTTTTGTKIPHGYNFEVYADANSGIVNAIPLKAMGRFSHEAVAIDPRTGYIYETEDRGDSCFYRFVPRVVEEGKKPRHLQLGDLQKGGTLYALKIKGAENFALNTTNNPNLPAPGRGGQPGLIKVGQEFEVEWVKVDNPDPVFADDSDTASGLGKPESVRGQSQAKGAAIFFRGEGAFYGRNRIFFVATQAGTPAFDSTRGNGQVWEYNPRKETLKLVIEASSAGDLLDEPDNVVVTPFGDLILCEDGGGVQFLVGVTKKGGLYQFAKNVIFANSTDPAIKDAFADNEFAGACFSPDGKTMFVNIQTPGVTFAIWGPWDQKRD